MKKNLIYIFIILLTTIITPSVFASTYDYTTHTLTADSSPLSDTDTSSGFIHDFIQTTSMTIQGLNGDVGTALVGLHDFIASTPVVGSGLTSSNSGEVADTLSGAVLDMMVASKIASIINFTLNFSGDTNISQNDFEYITSLKNYAKNYISTDPYGIRNFINSLNHSDDLWVKYNSIPSIMDMVLGAYQDATIIVNISGNTTFSGPVAIALTDKYNLSSSGTMTLPTGSDITTFFGSGKVLQDNEVIVDGVHYKANANNITFSLYSVEDASKAEISLNGLNPNYTLSLTGSIMANFTSLVSNGYVGNLFGILRIKVIPAIGSQLWNKTWNDANNPDFSTGQLLDGNGEYLGTRTFQINTASGTEFRVIFTNTGAYTYETTILSAENSDIELSKISSGSVAINSITLATIGISGLDFPKTLPSSGAVSDEFNLNITGTGDVSGENVFAKMKFTSGDFSKIKLNDTSLTNSGEYLGTGTFVVSATGLTLKIDVNGAGTYNYEASLVSSYDQNILVSNVLNGSIVVNPYQAPSSGGGGGGGGGGSYIPPVEPTTPTNTGTTDTPTTQTPPTTSTGIVEIITDCSSGKYKNTTEIDADISFVGADLNEQVAYLKNLGKTKFGVFEDLVVSDFVAPSGNKFLCGYEQALRGLQALDKAKNELASGKIITIDILQRAVALYRQGMRTMLEAQSYFAYTIQNHYDGFEIVKVGMKSALKLKVFRSNDAGFDTENQLNAMYVGKLNEVNLEKVMSARNRLLLISEKGNLTADQSVKAQLTDLLRATYAEFMTAINMK